MTPETAFAEFYSKLVCAAEQALSNGSPKHAMVVENREIIHALQKYFDNQGWGVEVLETATTEPRDYFGVLIIRRPSELTVKTSPNRLEFAKIKER